MSNLTNSIESLEVSINNAMAKIDELRADNCELRANAHHANEVADAFAKEAEGLRAKLARAKEALAEIVIPPQAEGSSLYYIETEDMQRATVVLAELESP